MYSAVQSVTQSSAEDLLPESVLFGRSSSMLDLREKLTRFCSAGVPILLQGEAGVGKGTLSAFIHRHWFSLHGSYARLSCASTDEHWAAFALCAVLKRSMLQTTRSAADTHPATLFLREVDELPSHLQRLLAILMTERKEEDGSAMETSPVCIVSSCTRDLRREMKHGHFRRDLFQQLAIGVVRVPPLRERVQDLPAICEYLRHRDCMQAGIDDRPFPPDLMERMLMYRWPGNLNELQSFIRRFVTLGPEHCTLYQKMGTQVENAVGKWMM